jgi:hypothetical protein
VVVAVVVALQFVLREHGQWRWYRWWWCYNAPELLVLQIVVVVAVVVEILQPTVALAALAS